MYNPIRLLDVAMDRDTCTYICMYMPIMYVSIIINWRYLLYIVHMPNRWPPNMLL